MEVEYKDDKLEALEDDPDETGGFSQAIVRAFRKRMRYIRAAVDERDFYSMKSLHFEKLKGERDQQRSMRLNDQWRLILEIIPGEPKNKLMICGIEKHYHD